MTDILDNTPTPWKFVNSDNKAVFRTYPLGGMESCLVTCEEVQAWIAEGNTPEAADA